MHVTCAVVAALLGLGAAALAQAPTIPLPSDLKIDLDALIRPNSWTFMAASSPMITYRHEYP